MKNIIEVVKENKTKIIKRGLIVLGAVAGLALAGLAFKGKDSDEDEYDCESEGAEIDESSDGPSEE